jgi:hypothetical protein
MASKYEYTKRCIEERRRWLDGLKCAPCGRCKHKFPPYVMDWHHRSPATKKFSIGSGAFRRSRTALLEEIAKCDLLCANCHRMVEFELGQKRKGATV